MNECRRRADRDRVCSRQGLFACERAESNVMSPIQVVPCATVTATLIVDRKKESGDACV